MSKNPTYKSIEDFIDDDESPAHKIDRAKNMDSTLLDLIEPENRLKLWLDLTPPGMVDNLRNFWRVNKLKGTLLITKRMKMIIEYDTLFFAKSINENRSEQLYHVTNYVLSIMRTMIFMYLSYNKKTEYHRGWVNIAYTISTVSKEMEDLFIVFSHILDTIKDFFNPEKNFQSKMKSIAEFISIVEQENLGFFSGLQRRFNLKNSKAKLDLKDDKKFFISDNISNLSLVYLLKPLCEVWFGSLFSCILYPKDCLHFWDMVFIHKEKVLYQFGLLVLEQMNSDIEQIQYSQCTSLYSELKLEIKHDVNFYAIPEVLKHLTKYLNANVLKNLFKESLKRATSAKSLFVFLTPKKDAKLQIEYFGVHYLRDRLKLIGKVIKKLLKGGLGSGMNLPRILAKIDEEKSGIITLKTLFEIFQNSQTSISNKFLGRMFILIDQDKKGYISCKELKDFLCLVPELIKDKMELFFKVEKMYASIEDEDVLDILISLEYTLCDNLTHVRHKLEDLYQRIHRHFTQKGFEMEEMLKFMNKDPSASQISRYMTIIDGKCEVDESNVSEEESETFTNQAKRGLLFVSNSNLSSTIAEKSRRNSTDATTGGSFGRPLKQVPVFNPSQFADKIVFETTIFEAKDLEENWPRPDVPEFPTMQTFFQK